MKILKINTQNQIYTNSNIPTKTVSAPKTQQNSELLLTQLNNLAIVNHIAFTGQNNGYEIGLSGRELLKRTKPERFGHINLLSADAPEYQRLSAGDKKALAHLVHAANLIGEINMKLDDENNIPFRTYLESEIKKGNLRAELTYELFKGQKGAFSQDMEFNHISLIKGMKQSLGKGVYPRDLSVEEFHNILERMIYDGEIEAVKKMLTQRSVVVRDGDKLKGIDYIDYFKKDFSKVADELEKAAQHSTNEDFNEFLLYQAEALRTADPMLDAYADKKWATLQDTPLEFTITRENYDDKMTETIFDNEKLLKLLQKNGIQPIAKDFIGGRVGIVNKEGTDFITSSKDLLPKLAELMPYRNEYTQTINKDNKQTMVDVDLVTVTGNVGEHRGKITLAENLPNIDKLSLTIGGGRRNVYHRQMRVNKDNLFEPYKKLLVPEQLAKLSPNSYHYFTIFHENAHSLGPNKGHEKLGKYRNIIEENKADIAAIAFTDKLTELGVYSEFEREALLINFVLQNYLKAKPDAHVAHRVRQVMQAKYFEDNDVVRLTKDGKIFVDVEKVVPTAQKMLKEIIRIQIDGDYKAAGEYVDRNFVWTPKMEYIAKELRKNSKMLNAKVNTPLADALSNN